MKNLFRSTLLLSLSAIVFVACGSGGGSSKASKAGQDAVSRRHAFGATVNGAKGNAGDRSKQSAESTKSESGFFGSSSGLHRFLGNEVAIATETAESESNENACERGGKATGELDEGASRKAQALVANVNFDQCNQDDTAILNGKLRIQLGGDDTAGAESIWMTMTGNVNAKAKNAKDEYAEHNMRFNEFRIAFHFSSQPSEGEMMLSPSVNISCSGTVDIDGEKKTCEELMNEGAKGNAAAEGSKENPEKGPSTETPSSESSNFITKLARETINGEARLALAIEKLGKQVDDVQVYLYSGTTAVETSDYAYGKLDDSFKALIDEQMGVVDANYFKGMSVNAVAVFMTSDMNPALISASMIGVKVLYTDGTAEFYKKELN